MVEHVVRLVKVCGDESMAMLVVVPWMGGFMQQHLHGVTARYTIQQNLPCRQSALHGDACI
jgi:hypothetical protein